MEEYNLQLLNESNLVNNLNIPLIEDKKIFIIRKVKRTQIWTKEDDHKLKNLAERFKCQNWKEIARNFVNRSAIQCCSRYKRIRPGIIKGLWTETEDKLLLNLVNKFGKNWSLLSRYMPSRTGKQIRERFINSLDPSINRDKFTCEEDRFILHYYSKYGTSWSKIAECIKDRTADMVKNRFYSYLHKNIHGDGYKDRLKRNKNVSEGVLNNNDSVNKKRKLFRVEDKNDTLKKKTNDRCKQRLKQKNLNLNKNNLNYPRSLNFINSNQQSDCYTSKFDLNPFDKNNGNSLNGYNNINRLNQPEKCEEINSNLLNKQNVFHDLINKNSIENSFNYKETEPMNLINQYKRLQQLHFKISWNVCKNGNKSNCECNACNTFSDFKEQSPQLILNPNNILQDSYMKKDKMDLNR